MSQTMIISNGGSGSLDWSASKTAGWLNLSSESGTSGLSVTVSENLTGLNPGTYSDNITITAAGAINSPLIVPVTLTVTAGGGSTFVYDGDGRRVKKTENGQTTVYVNRYFESNLTASENTTYYYMGGRLTAMRKGESLRYVHQDHLTGTSLMTDTSGAQVGTTMKYYPFGGTRSGSVPTDIRFTGQRLDESGLYYFNARYYDPQIGRFISADTVVPGPFNPQTFNRYAYVMNNPLKYNDPSGHDLGIMAWDHRSVPEPTDSGTGYGEGSGHKGFSIWAEVKGRLDVLPKGSTAEFIPFEEDGWSVQFTLPDGTVIGGNESMYSLLQTPEQKGWGASYLGKISSGPRGKDVPLYVISGKGSIASLMAALNAIAISLAPLGVFALPSALTAPILAHECFHFEEQSDWGLLWYANYAREYQNALRSLPSDMIINLVIYWSWNDAWRQSLIDVHDSLPSEMRAIEHQHSFQ